MKKQVQLVRAAPLEVAYKIPKGSVRLIFARIPKMGLRNPQIGTYHTFVYDIISECCRHLLSEKGVLVLYYDHNQHTIGWRMGEEPWNLNQSFSKNRETMFPHRRTFARSWNNRLWVVAFSHNKAALRNPHSDPSKANSRIIDFLSKSATMDWYEARDHFVSLQRSLKRKHTPFISQKQAIHYGDVNRFAVESYTATLRKLFSIFAPGGSIIFNPFVVKGEKSIIEKATSSLKVKVVGVVK